MWLCRDCGSSHISRSKLLKHFRLVHGQYGHRHAYPCAYSYCPCTFKTWNALRSHLCRSHGSEQQPQKQNSSESTKINCHVCGVTDIPSVNDYILHINKHLRSHETVSCMFKDCSFKSNVYSTFKSHKRQKHCQCSLTDFKEGIVKTQEVRGLSDDTFSNEEINTSTLEEDSSCIDTGEVPENLPKLVELKFASLLLKPENHYHVPGTAVDELLEDLHYLLSDASFPLSYRIIVDTLQKHRIDNDEFLVKDLVTSLSTANPLLTAIKHGGPLASAFKRKEYYSENFKVVHSVEYVLEAKGNIIVQYVPILESLQNLLGQNDLLDKVVESHSSQQLRRDVHQYRSIQDGQFFKANNFFSDELRIYVCLYVDDFEICNPLGTSRKKHKICAIYWILGNVPSMFQSTLSSKTEDVITYGFEKILRPLLQDLQTLEQQEKFDRMGTPAKLLVILGENNCERLNLPTGIPNSLNDLKREIQTQLRVLEDFRLQFKDPDFNDFVNLTSTSDIQDKATLKVIQLPSSTSFPTTSSVPEIISSSQSLYFQLQNLCPQLEVRHGLNVSQYHSLVLMLRFNCKKLNLLIRLMVLS
uniref:Uncharacterized protein LOC116955880 n=1 Tax=Petromyzon marinus TaxID=7757 RepID=A0AAJ7UD90_PETMA|nr:uncharacterized protein LOC116955880 [Petromyzon marinus]